MVFDKEAKAIQEKKEFSTNGTSITGCCKQKNPNRSTYNTLHEVQLQGDKRPQDNPDTTNLIDEKAETAWNTLAHQQPPEHDTNSTDTMFNT